MSVVVLGLALLVGIAHAATSQALLTTTMYDAVSTPIGLNKTASFSANNHSGSPRAVYAIVKRQRQGTGVWYETYSTLMQPGTPAGFSNMSDNNGSLCLWTLQLNPYGIGTTGCNAVGSIYY